MKVRLSHLTFVWRLAQVSIESSHSLTFSETVPAKGVLAFVGLPVRRFFFSRWWCGVFYLLVFRLFLQRPDSSLPLLSSLG